MPQDTGTSRARADTSDYLRLFLDDLPLLDVRAPIEFAAGAFPHADNRPLLDDLQREQIGKRYKQAGPAAAIALGEALATPAIRAERLSAWCDFVQSNPGGYLYCFRGGLRSEITQRWLAESGLAYPRVLGGYKALRGFLLSSFERLAGELPLILLAGPTGAGKTVLLQTLPDHLDLEGLARHRGSAFGATGEAQPAQIDWENAVAIGLLKHAHRRPGGTALLIEDESRLIGRIWLPPFLQRAMAQAPLLVLEADRESRARAILHDYVENPWRACQARYAEAAPARFSEELLGNLARIRKRLGGERHDRLARQFRAAMRRLTREDCAEDFLPGIETLLREYYDPMYAWQLERRAGAILLRGEAGVLREWWMENRADALLSS